VDLIVSQAVLEHVDDLENTYDAFAQWLRPGGRMSHEIDFHSRGLTMPWNGHWDDRDARDLTFITLPGFVTL
jgi:hypothetical protein